MSFSRINVREMGEGIPTYARYDNPDASYRVDSANTATNERRINWFLDGNMEDAEK